MGGPLVGHAAMRTGLCGDVRVSREEGNTCWECRISDRTSDHVDGSRITNVSQPGNICEGWLSGDVHKVFVEDHNGLEVRGELLVVFPEATRVNGYPE